MAQRGARIFIVTKHIKCIVMDKGKIPASKETLNGLMVNTSNVIRDMYGCLQVDILTLEQLETQNAKPICILCQQLIIAVNYSLMDIGVSVRASIGSEKAYEKRFHLKNLKASISESYKLIFNYDKAKKKSIWSKIGVELNDYNHVIEDLYKRITAALVVFADNYVNQELRNLTLHYDDDMMRVYEATIGINNEDAEMKVLCEYMDILQSMRFFITLIEANEEIAFMPEKVTINQRAGINSIFEQLINKEGKLMEVVKMAIDETGRNIDSFAQMDKRFRRLQSFIEQQAPICVTFNELDNLKILLNAQMLLQFMIGDLAAIAKAYLQSKSEEEHKMNLRRFVVIQTSTLVHLYGYNDAEQDKSIWKLLISFLPQSDSSLIEECSKTETQLKKLVTDSVDKKERALYVHLVNNGNSKFGVPDTLKAIDAINPVREIVEVNVLLAIMKQVRDWLNHIMEVLSKEARESRLESERKIEGMFDDMIYKIANSNLPDEQKKQLLDMFTSNKDKIMKVVRE